MGSDGRYHTCEDGFLDSFSAPERDIVGRLTVLA